MKIRAGIPVFALLLLAPVLQGSGWAAMADINFESLPSNQAVVYGAALDVQFASLGVVFDYARPNQSHVPAFEIAPNSPAAHSGMFVAVGPDFGAEFLDLDFSIKFTSAQSKVQFYAGTKCSGAQGLLYAYEEDGTTIVDFDFEPLVAGQTSTFFSVSVSPTSSPGIWGVRFRADKSGGPCDESIDDLHIEGNPAPSPGAPPVVSLSAPLPGNQNYLTTPLDAVGTVQSSNLFPELEVELVSLDNPSGDPSTETFYPPVPKNNPNSLPFSAVLREAGLLPIGHYVVNAIARDYWGQQTKASVAFYNGSAGQVVDPSLILPFRFAIIDDICQMAYYQNGAEAFFFDSSKSPIVVPGAVAEKWRTVNAPILGPHHTLGCPLHAADTSITGWTTQDFERGRIYVPTGGAAVYVPAILTNAMPFISHTAGSATKPIDISIDFYQIGWPVSDPDWSLDAEDPTWVFQRFDQRNLGAAYQNTMEIRGRSPSLYIERIGGDLTELAASQSHAQDKTSTPDGPAVVDYNTPTLWQVVPCHQSGTDLWPTSCDLSGFPQPPYTTSSFDAGPACGASPGCSDSTCGSDDCPHFRTASLLGATPTYTWRTTIPAGTASYYQGIVRALDETGPHAGSHLAYEDFFLAHEYCNATGEGSTDSSADQAGLAIAECIGIIFGDTNCGDDWSALFDGSSCRSDWNLHTRPLPGDANEHYLAQGNLDASKDFEIEFEAYWAKHYFRFFEPTSGDLVLAHGRPIADCAHCDPYKSEIHPPDTVIVSRSQVEMPYANEPPIRVTDAYLWGNGFLPNFSTVTAIVYAPPRTSARAHMALFEHEDGYWRKNSVDVVHDFNDTGVAVSLTHTGQVALVLETFLGEYIMPSTSDTDVSDFVDNWNLSWEE